jgi:hypothetical protein
MIIGRLIFASILDAGADASILMIEARIGAWFAARRRRPGRRACRAPSGATPIVA